MEVVVTGYVFFPCHVLLSHASSLEFRWRKLRRKIGCWRNIKGRKQYAKTKHQCFHRPSPVQGKLSLFRQQTNANSTHSTNAVHVEDGPLFHRPTVTKHVNAHPQLRISYRTPHTFICRSWWLFTWTGKHVLKYFEFTQYNDLKQNDKICKSVSWTFAQM